jgi:GNAT superfamily N-acetyltransferase
LNPFRDLGQVTDIIEEGFGDDLTGPGRRALREMQFLSRMGPVLWLLVAMSPEFREYHSGFVWVEEGQVVGTLHITRPGPYSRRWLISNVAVRVYYRGRGIGRSLMEKALAWAQEQGGEAVFLRVRRDNTAAWSLYESLGFQPLHDSVSLRLGRVPQVRKTATSEAGLAYYQPRQWQAVQGLARLALPSDLRWLEPVRDDDLRLSLDRRLAEWWTMLTTGRKICRLVAHRDERIVAAMVVKIAGQRGNHSLLLHVHPSHRGEVEEMLVTEALSRLWPYRDRAVIASLPVGYAEILDVLKRYGFVERKTLTLMQRSLNTSNR